MQMLIFRLMVFLYSASGGRIGGKMRGRDVLLLTTTGRKTGKTRTLPLIYIMDGADYVVTASKGGADKHPGWFFNVRSSPRASIQVNNRHMQVTAEVAGPEKKAALWEQLVQVAPFYADYQKHTQRQIPMVILHPVDGS